ncbi:hypothetical protein, partial [Klebsiella indica]|uniref:hypothetical protein n=1 Tax=Klebsiella indica TaxID=2582917 RepID=UPI0031B70111
SKQHPGFSPEPPLNRTFLAVTKPDSPVNGLSLTCISVPHHFLNFPAKNNCPKVDFIQIINKANYFPHPAFTSSRLILFQAHFPGKMRASAPF